MIISTVFFAFILFQRPNLYLNCSKDLSVYLPGLETETDPRCVYSW